MVKNPSYYNPVRSPERALARRNVVFEQMEKAGKITEKPAGFIVCPSIGTEFFTVLTIRMVSHHISARSCGAYFRQKKPKRGDYPSWNQQAYVDDSIAWADNPLFGWIEKNPKPDGTNTIYMPMALRYIPLSTPYAAISAEEAVKRAYVRPSETLFKEKRNAPDAPYSTNTAEITVSARKKLIENAIKQSERMRVARSGRTVGCGDRASVLDAGTYDGIQL